MGFWTGSKGGNVGHILLNLPINEQRCSPSLSRHHTNLKFCQNFEMFMLDHVAAIYALLICNLDSKSAWGVHKQFLQSKQ